MTPWEILGIAQDADKRDIKRAYGKLIKENRPDDSPEKFQQIRSAYEYMLDSQSQSSTPPQYFSPITSPTKNATALDPLESTEQVEKIEPDAETETPAKNNETSDCGDATPIIDADNQTPINDSADADSDTDHLVATQVNEFIHSFEKLLAKFPANGKLTNRDLELCRLETVTLMRSEVLNHWHAREYLAAGMFSLLCKNIDISTGLWSTTTNFPAQFLHYLDEQFQWTENEVELCEQCEDDSAGLVFHVIHNGRSSSLPNWSQLPEPSKNAELSEHSSGINKGQNTGQSLRQKIASLFTPGK